MTMTMTGPRETPAPAGVVPIMIDGVCVERCAAIADEVLAWQISEPWHAGGTNVGGWKSGYGALERTENLAELGRAIRRELARHALPQDLVSWAMVNRRGSFHKRHVHGARVTWIFYASAGDPPVAPTIFEVAPALGSRLEIPPVAGRLLIVPGYLWHSVPPYDGEAPRITIAGDAVARGDRDPYGQVPR